MCAGRQRAPRLARVYAATTATAGLETTTWCAYLRMLLPRGALIAARAALIHGDDDRATAPAAISYNRCVNHAFDIRNFLTERGIEHVKIGVFDTDGILRGKYLSRDKFLSALDKNLGFCDVILGWDSNDQLYDNTTFTGCTPPIPMPPCVSCPHQRDIPFELKTALFLGEFAGRAEAVCRAAHCGACSSGLRAWDIW